MVWKFSKLKKRGISFVPINFTKSTGQKYKNNLVTELHCFLFYKTNSIRSFLSQKNEPRNCPQKHILRFPGQNPSCR